MTSAGLLARRAVISLALLVCAGAAPAQTSLRADLRLADPLTGATLQPEADQPVRLEVTLTDTVSGQPTRGIDLFGWVRPAEPDMVGCARAAQAFRATRRTPLGSSDLNGILVISLNRDASVGVIDPKLNLYSSNMIAARSLAEMPPDLAVDRHGMRALLPRPASGELRAMSLLTGEVVPLATGLERPTGVVAVSDGDLWVAGGTGRLTRLTPTGEIAGSQWIGDRQVHLRHLSDPDSDLIGAFSEDGGLAVIDGATDRTILHIRTGAPLADAAILGAQAVIALPEGQPAAELRFVDAPNRVLRLPTGLAFERVATGPDGRVAILYTPGSETFALVDTAVGRLVQSVELTDATVSEVTFGDNVAFLMSHDGGFVAAVDLATVGPGREAVIRHVNLGARTTTPEVTSELLVPLFPSPQILAVEPENQTGWVIGEIASSVEMPPMDSIRLRGGVPHRVRIVDRSFREHDPGHYETVWAFPAGEYELVLTTAIGNLSTCLPFRVRGEASRVDRIAVRIHAEAAEMPLRAGAEQEIVIHLRDERGHLDQLETLTLLVPSLRSSWSGTTIARRDPDGSFRARIALPHAGTFALHPLGLPPGYALASAAVIEAIEEDR